MASDDTISAYIVDTQIAIFDEARHDLQLSIAEIARRTKLSKPTVDAWAQGRNMLSLWGVKRLLRVKELAPLLSRLFEPEDCALICRPGGIDHDKIAPAFQDYLQTKERAHHPESEAGREIGPGERNGLDAKIVMLPLKGAVA